VSRKWKTGSGVDGIHGGIGGDRWMGLQRRIRDKILWTTSYCAVLEKYYGLWIWGRHRVIVILQIVPGTTYSCMVTRWLKFSQN
jgi:hypothetical protein